VLRLTREIHDQMIAHAYAGFPLEACGLLAGEPGSSGDARSAGDRAGDGVDGVVHRFYPTDNEAKSSKVYTVPGREYLRADRDAEGSGWQLLGVMHSHTHTDAYPSPTDVAQAPDPEWHYVIVSLRDDLPSLRSFRIVDGGITEEPVTIHGF
jgi:[CysO sulfur-carrier protein]-S-L-cysteine hydrolase